MSTRSSGARYNDAQDNAIEMALQTAKKASDRPLGEQVYARLRGEIMSCILAPGESFSESQLAETYGVGKAPVRWALAALSREGLLQARPRQGHTVAPVTVESANDLFGLRLILEPAAARLAAGRADIALLKALQAQLLRDHRAVKKGTGAQLEHRRSWIDANKQFHIEITRAAGNERLTRVITTVLEESQRTNHVIFSVYDESVSMKDDHPDLINALARGDGETAERVAREHLERSRRIVIDALLADDAARRARNDRPGAPAGGAP
jgi:DNA-binding GntR family transcriptional regulator